MRAQMTILMLVIVITGGTWENMIPMVKAGVSPSQCNEEKKLLINACKAVIFGQNPSANCCQRVRVTKVECVCPSVTPKFAALINVQRVIKQIEACGRTVPRNFKCGSITTPP